MVENFERISYTLNYKHLLKIIVLFWLQMFQKCAEEFHSYGRVTYISMYGDIPIPERAKFHSFVDTLGNYSFAFAHMLLKKTICVHY